MNLSLNWLNEYVNTDGIPLPRLISGLTMSGSKVEKYKDLSEPLSKIVIGKVVEIKKHENSDKLWICRVDTGESGEVQIVTGAQNVTQNAVVPVVLDGGVVLNRHDGTVTKIKKGKLRGEISEGMLCSPDELGLDKSDLPYADEDGILILSNDPRADELVIGGDALDFLGLNDSVIEFEITNNRPDCLAVTGLAREVSAAFGLPLNIKIPEYKGFDYNITDELKVELENKRLCSRYMAGLVKNVKIAPSPRWMAARLKSAGIRPINNIVDITNYVMLEYGNPLHAFDKRLIKGGKIVVRSASDNEEITLLDGNTVALDSDVLVIADEVKPIAVAGVMGGEFSGIADDTAEVVFEAACFDGVSVRRAAKKIGRRTESSSRFEKSLNPNTTKTALFRALQLVEELGCGEVANTVIDCVNYQQKQGRVEHDFKKINEFLGADIPESEQVDIFKKLGFDYDYSDKNVIISLDCPRSDVTLSCDLAEEVARIYGYNNIESTLPRRLSPVTEPNEYDGKIRKLVTAFTSLGCNECVTYSFVSGKMGGENAVKIRNPFGEETSVMRTSMIPSMLKVISDNLNAGNSEARLFEIGRTYTPGKEYDMLCIGLYGKNESFYTLKGVLEEVSDCFKLQTDVIRCTESPFHPGRAAQCGYGKFGEISPLVLRDYSISENERVYIAEIDLEKFLSQSSGKTIYAQIPKYPAAVRDLSLVCDNETESGTIVEIIEKSCGSHLESVEFFDIFTGGNLNENEKSISYKLTFRKSGGTLTDEEVDKAIKTTLSKLQKNNIKLRG